MLVKREETCREFECINVLTDSLYIGYLGRVMGEQRDRTIWELVHLISVHLMEDVLLGVVGRPRAIV